MSATTQGTTARVFGSGIRRREDPRLLTGTARYTADFTLPGMVHAGKGYPAYVLAPVKGAPAVYRVRVGKFKERREADTVAARLQKEEQFKPWVVR